MCNSLNQDSHPGLVVARSMTGRSLSNIIVLTATTRVQPMPSGVDICCGNTILAVSTTMLTFLPLPCHSLIACARFQLGLVVSVDLQHAFCSYTQELQQALLAKEDRWPRLFIVRISLMLLHDLLALDAVVLGSVRETYGLMAYLGSTWASGALSSKHVEIGCTLAI